MQANPNMFEQIAEYVKKLGFDVQVATNGTLIKNRQAQWLKAIRADVQVSLDGSTADIHDHMRPGNKAFDRTLSGINALVKAVLKLPSEQYYRQLINMIS